LKRALLSFTAAADGKLPYIVPLLIGCLTFSRFVTELVAVAFCLYFLLHSLLHRDWDWLKLPPVMIALAAWVFLMLVVAPLSADPGESLSRLAAWLRFPLLFAGIVHLVLSDGARIKKALWPLLPFFAFIAVDLLYQYLTGTSINGTEVQGGRLTSILNRPTSGWFLGKGYFAALYLVSAVSLGMKGAVTKQALAFYLLAIPILVVVPLTGDRSPILLILAATAISGAVVLASLRRHRGNSFSPWPPSSSAMACCSPSKASCSSAASFWSSSSRTSGTATTVKSSPSPGWSLPTTGRAASA
jgi:hypothetical protein